MAQAWERERVKVVFLEVISPLYCTGLCGGICQCPIHPHAPQYLYIFYQTQWMGEWSERRIKEGGGDLEGKRVRGVPWSILSAGVQKIISALSQNKEGLQTLTHSLLSS